MSIIKCPECGGKVSSEAKSCPHCGAIINANAKSNVGQSRIANTNTAQSNTVNDATDYVYEEESFFEKYKVIIIIALVIILGVVGYFIYRGQQTKSGEMIATDTVDTAAIDTIAEDTVSSNIEEDTFLEENSSEDDNVVDILDMDNNTKFNIVKFRTGVRFSKDYWFSEKSGNVTDKYYWRDGDTKGYGYFTYHRFNKTQYTCTFLTDDASIGRYEDGYGDNTGYGHSVRDIERSTLPQIDGYYVLDLREWDGYVPLYLPYSHHFIISNFNKGDIKFEFR